MARVFPSKPHLGRLGGKETPLLPAGHRGNITKLQLSSKNHKQTLPLSISSGPVKDKRFCGNSSGTKTLPALNITSSSVRAWAKIHADQGHAGSVLTSCQPWQGAYPDYFLTWKPGSNGVRAIKATHGVQVLDVSEGCAVPSAWPSPPLGQSTVSKRRLDPSCSDSQRGQNKWVGFTPSLPTVHLFVPPPSLSFKEISQGS